MLRDSSYFSRYKNDFLSPWIAAVASSRTDRRQTGHNQIFGCFWKGCKGRCVLRRVTGAKNVFTLGQEAAFELLDDERMVAEKAREMVRQQPRFQSVLT
jgi:hypothetical protein